jgi:hypothetical protein
MAIRKSHGTVVMKGDNKLSPGPGPRFNSNGSSEMKLGIIAASMLIGAASLVSISANAQTTQPSLNPPKPAVAPAGALPAGPTTVRPHSIESIATNTPPAQPAQRSAPGN